MADLKISQLTAATTPLAGTEVVPIVQSSTTKKVAVSNMFGANVYTFLNTPNSANLAAAVTDETGSGALVFGTGPTLTNSGSGNPSANFTNTIFQDVSVNFFNAASTTGNKITLQFASNGGATTTNSIVSYGSAMGGGLDNAIEIGNASGKARVTTAGNVAATTGDFILVGAGKGIEFAGNNSVLWRCGAGSPEGVVTAPVGSLFTRTDGGAATTLYVKESGTGNTGWVAK